MPSYKEVLVWFYMIELFLIMWITKATFIIIFCIKRFNAKCALFNLTPI